MPNHEYVSPKWGSTAFNCSHCNAYAQQLWYCIGIVPYREVKQFTLRNHEDLESLVFSHPVIRAELRGPHDYLNHLISICDRCNKYTYWINEHLVYPRKITAPMANQDMPDSVLEYFNEAREVSAISPRSAAALLRITAKKLCEFLGENESNLNRAIGNLSKKGLPHTAIEALDALRIYGNEGGAHEGNIDLSGNDNEKSVNGLFKLVNFIVEKTISDPKAIKDIYDPLPEDKKSAAIKKGK